MHLSLSKRRTLASGALMLVAMLASPACLAQDVPLPSVGDFQNDEVWRWRQIDNLTGMQEFEFGRRARITGDRLVFLRRGRESTVEQEFVTTTEPGASPDRPWRVWPLKIGSRWSYATHWTNSDGRVGDVTQSASVVALESVQVPAGTFDAFRIEHRGTWQLRAYNQMRFSGMQDDTYWYAPSINVDVKHVRRLSGPGAISFTQELISHTGGPTR